MPWNSIMLILSHRWIWHHFINSHVILDTYRRCTGVHGNHSRQVVGRLCRLRLAMIHIWNEIKTAMDLSYNNHDNYRINKHWKCRINIMLKQTCLKGLHRKIGRKILNLEQQYGRSLNQETISKHSNLNPKAPSMHFRGKYKQTPCDIKHKHRVNVLKVVILNGWVNGITIHQYVQIPILE